MTRGREEARGGGGVRRRRTAGLTRRCAASMCPTSGEPSGHAACSPWQPPAPRRGVSCLSRVVVHFARRDAGAGGRKSGDGVDGEVEGIVVMGLMGAYGTRERRWEGSCVSKNVTLTSVQPSHHSPTPASSSSSVSHLPFLTRPTS
jgi:hypothetical protein